MPGRHSPSSLSLDRENNEELDEGVDRNLYAMFLYKTGLKGQSHRIYRALVDMP